MNQPDGGTVAIGVTGASIVVTLVLVAVELPGREALGDMPASLRPVLQSGLAAAWCVPGAILARRRRGLPFGRLALLAGSTHAAAGLLVALATDDGWSVWTASWLIVVEIPILGAIVQLFPSGRPLPRWNGYLVLTVGAGSAGVLVAALETSPAQVAAAGAAGSGGDFAVPLLAFSALGALVPLVVRFGRTVGPERRAVGWFISVMAAGLAVPALVVAGGEAGVVAAQVFTAGQLAVASYLVLRYRVWGLAPMPRRSLHRVVTAVDSERRRMRAELHDGVGAGLTSIRLKIDAARGLVGARPERAAEMLDSASSDIGTVLHDVRRLIDGMRPAILDRVDLVSALRARADELSLPASGVTVTVDSRGDIDGLAPAVETAAYLVVTEALTNVVRHASASRCEVTLNAESDELLIDVVDDGIGENDEAPLDGGVGLSSMASRVGQVGGYVTSGRPERGGYSIRAVIPRLEP